MRVLIEKAMSVADTAAYNFVESTTNATAPSWPLLARGGTRARAHNTEARM